MAVEDKVHAYLSSYCVVALENTPWLLSKFLSGYEVEDPIWDYRPSPERFCLREAMAHLADWNGVYEDRLRRTLSEDNPLLPNCDEEAIAIQNRYSESNPVESLNRFIRTRPNLVHMVRDLKSSDWDRSAIREGLGAVTLDQQVAIIMGHDAYHVKQVMDYIAEHRA